MTRLLPASAAHAGCLALIHAQAFATAERWSQQDFAALLEAPGAFGLLFPAGGFVLARVAGDEAEILTLAVVPTLRRRGIGRCLLGRTIEHAACLGARALFLEVAADNAAARGLYAAHGLAEIGRRTEYYPDGGDALVLRIALSREAAASER